MSDAVVEPLVTKGRWGVKIPTIATIEANHDGLYGVNAFIGGLLRSNETSGYKIGPTAIKELVVPPTSKKPLAVVRSFNYSVPGAEQEYGDRLRRGEYPISVNTGYTRQEILTAPLRSPGAFAVFLSYYTSHEMRADFVGGRQDPTRVNFRGESVTVGHAWDEAYDQLAGLDFEDERERRLAIHERKAEIIESKVHNMLEATAELLA